jgi:hypothetical protein
MRQEKYSSSPALERGLNGLLVKNRCALLSDPREIELVWFIQWQSMQQGALDKFAADLLAAFPERLGTPAMLKIGAKPDDIYNADQVRVVRGDFESQRFSLRGEIADEESDFDWLVPEQFLEETEAGRLRLAEIQTKKAQLKKSRVEARTSHVLSRRLLFKYLPPRVFGNCARPTHAPLPRPGFQYRAAPHDR